MDEVLAGSSRSRLRMRPERFRERLGFALSGAAPLTLLLAAVDDYEALLSGTGEVTVVWSGRGASPKFLGPASAVLPSGRRIEAILDYRSWLNAPDATALAPRVAA